MPNNWGGKREGAGRKSRISEEQKDYINQRTAIENKLFMNPLRQEDESNPDYYERVRVHKEAVLSEVSQLLPTH